MYINRLYSGISATQDCVLELVMAVHAASLEKSVNCKSVKMFRQQFHLIYYSHEPNRKGVERKCMCRVQILELSHMSLSSLLC